MTGDASATATGGGDATIAGVSDVPATDVSPADASAAADAAGADAAAGDDPVVTGMPETGAGTGNAPLAALILGLMAIVVAAGSRIRIRA